MPERQDGDSLARNVSLLFLITKHRKKAHRPTAKLEALLVRFVRPHSRDVAAVLKSPQNRVGVRGKR